MSPRSRGLALARGETAASFADTPRPAAARTMKWRRAESRSRPLLPPVIAAVDGRLSNEKSKRAEKPAVLHSCM